PDLLHQVMVYHQANQRQGTSNTLTRGQVSGGGRKPFSQKGTGRARQGTIRAPHMRHGGTVFGPHPRSYRTRMPRRMRQQAIRIALSGKAAGERLIIVDGLESLGAKTKGMATALQALGLKGAALVVTGAGQDDVAKAVRNLPRTKAMRADLLNVLDLVRYETLVMTQDAVKRAEELWSDPSRVKKEVTAVA
ncbi:MAG: 50S ribosomal protein L4, partial [Dehalococcoidia bacterium]